MTPQHRLECTVHTEQGDEIALVVYWSESCAQPTVHRILRRRYGELKDVTATPFERTYYPEIRAAVVREMEQRAEVERDAVANERGDERRMRQ